MIHVVIGTKAQLIKMAPVLVSLNESGIEYNLVHTSQHAEQIDDLLDNFQLRPPDYTFLQGSGDVTSRRGMLAWIIGCVLEFRRHREQIFRGDRDGIVLVHGDTFSTLMGAMLARTCGMRVGHVEAGLRSYHIFHPFPEELTRILTSRLAHFHYCPGAWAMRALEGRAGEIIDLGANTLYDSLHAALSSRRHAACGAPRVPFGVVSMHRYENIFNRKRFETCIEIIEAVARRYRLIFIMHRPTEQQARKYGLWERLQSNPDIVCRGRSDYFSFLGLLSRSELLVSDGGSNQEESYYLGLPCLLLRKATERPEGLTQNVVLSEYRSERAMQFCDQLPSLRRDPCVLPATPSDILVAHCRQRLDAGAKVPLAPTDAQAA